MLQDKVKQIYYKRRLKLHLNVLVCVQGSAVAMFSSAFYVLGEDEGKFISICQTIDLGYFVCVWGNGEERRKDVM